MKKKSIKKASIALGGMMNCEQSSSSRNPRAIALAKKDITLEMVMREEDAAGPIPVTFRERLFVYPAPEEYCYQN